MYSYGYYKRRYRDTLRVLLYFFKVSAYLTGMGSMQFCRGRGERSRPRRGRLNSRQGRGEATLWKNPPSPRCIAVANLVALSQTVW